MNKKSDRENILKSIISNGGFLPADNPTFCNPVFEAASLRILIARLSPLSDVDRSSPHLFLAAEARRALPDAYIDMGFAPGARDHGVLEKAEAAWLTGVQSLRSAKEFDVVLVSNSFVLELINLPVLLLRSGIPVWASERNSADPVIIMGGSNAMVSQSLIRDNGDCMTDAIFFGEGEGRIGPLLKAVETGPRFERISRLRESGIEGLWVAGKFPEEPLPKAVLDAPSVDDIVTSYPVLNTGEASTGRLQISYGCPAFCSFCFEGYDRKPYREVSFVDMLEAARALKLNQGCSSLELYSFNFNTYHEIVPLLTELNRLFYRVSFKSQRVDILSENPGLVELEVAAGKSSFTLGIEGISERCRALLNKSLTVTMINELLNRLFREKVREIKLFYILTGDENESDIDEFTAFVKKSKDLRQYYNPGLRVIFSFGLLVRMPGTPMQFSSLKLDPGPWRELEGALKSLCETSGFEYRLATPWTEYAVTQVMALGGYWLWEPIMELAGKGYFYDGSLPGSYWKEFREWMEQNDRWTEVFLGEKNKEYPFALSFVKSRVGNNFLSTQYEKSIAGQDSGYCLGRVGRQGRCLGCGACVDENLKENITRPRGIIARNRNAVEELKKCVAEKARMNEFCLTAYVPAEFAGVDREWLSSAFMRDFFKMFPRQLDNLLSAEESMFTLARGNSGKVPFYGETVFALKAWDVELIREDLNSGCQEGVGLFGAIHEVHEDYTAGKYKSAEISFSCSQAVIPDADRVLSEFLRAHHINFTLLRMEHGYGFEVANKKRARELIAGASYSLAEGVYSFRVTVGPRCDLNALYQAFGCEIDAFEIFRLVLK